jgi:cardiolipin synthase
LQASFLVDWYFTSRTLVSGKRYFPHEGNVGDAIVQVVPSNPVGEVRTIMSGMVKLLSTAKNHVYLQTPYFMPNEPFLLAMSSAAMSGADVRLMIPMRSDSWVADHISMSYLGDVMKAGVKVYLYSGGMLHSKTVVCDDYVSSVGSANLDFRSFYYNFEVNAFIYDRSVALGLKRAFLDDAEHCHQLTWSEYCARPFLHRCLESFARLFSPLL